MFYDPQQYSFTAALEANWRRVYDEYLGVKEHMRVWVETERYGDGMWKVLMLFTMPDGSPIEENIRRCPVTAALVEEHLPRRGVVTFSELHPKTNIQPHKGKEGWKFLRAHLGLQVPPGDCVFKVNDEARHWEPGKLLVFDDQARHEAWNHTDQERVVLLFDFLPDLYMVHSR